MNADLQVETNVKIDANVKNELDIIDKKEDDINNVNLPNSKNQNINLQNDLDLSLGKPINKNFIKNSGVDDGQNNQVLQNNHVKNSNQVMSQINTKIEKSSSKKNIYDSGKIDGVVEMEQRRDGVFNHNDASHTNEKMINVEIEAPQIKISNEVTEPAPTPSLELYNKSSTFQENEKIRTVGGRVIPKLNPSLAIGLLIINIFFPGLGTMIVGCVSHQSDVCCGWVCVGLLQMIFASCIFGWVWAVISACAIVSVANDPDYSDNVVVIVKQSN
jgi:hypothetical protein